MLWLMLRPHQFITGAADAGVYVNLGANIAKTGSIVIHDDVLADMDITLQQAFLRPIDNPIANSYVFPAFFVMNGGTGVIMPQFYPLHPVWQAVVYDFGGVSAELLLPGLWGVLGALVIYLTTRQITDWRIAALALVGLSLNELQVWFSRYPTSETLTQYFFWVSIWGTVVWLGNRKPPQLWALLAGVSLGMTFLTRIDMLFLLPLLLLIIVWQWRRQQAAWGWFALPVLLLCTYSVIHAMWQSQPYFYELYAYALKSLLHGPVGLFLALVLGLTGLGLFAYFYDEIMALLVKFERPLRIISIVIILTAAIYGWFIRPELFAASSITDKFSTATLPVLDGENLIRLGWYLSPLGIWLGILGTCLLIWYADWQKSVLIMMGIFFALFYLWRIRNNPVQIYAMRRYVPVAFPLFVIGAAYFVGWLAKHRQLWVKATAVILAILWLGSTVWFARGFVSQVDYVGMPEQIAQLSQQMAPNAIVIFNDPAVIGQGDIIGTPLRFLHGIDVFTLRDPDGITTAVFDEALAQWQAGGRTVYWADVPDGYAWPSATWELTEVGSYLIETMTLEARYDRKPTEILNNRWSGIIMEVQPSQSE
jgi:4-amino-4-deoxy-L-arabinose transferase-like glycosyltransferase